MKQDDVQNDLEEIASIAFNAVSFYSWNELGQTPVQFWDELSPERKDEITEIVAKIGTGEISTVAWLHEHWIQGRRADGWKYAAYYDDMTKHHPNMVMAAWLTPDERTKYLIFISTVNAGLRHCGLYMNMSSKDETTEDQQTS